ncbi:receptor-transporting protein 4 isoform X2 [Suricata suricatta]|uniref:receptor-transporting protein 4 isoform X2 n=1 Tax=Suricata suricatta TaxID=37032 RepID=UPI001155DEF9|nr:receptor-transporting protein 4 isoform X2 [Suricata suricatta]
MDSWPQFTNYGADTANGCQIKLSYSADMAPQSQEKKTVLDVGTWEQIFQELMQQEKPRARWTLKMDANLEPSCLAEGWKQYELKGFGRFQCSSCHRNWASAHVHILCHMYLEPHKSQGQVIMRLFAQRCKRCSWSRFENPEFSPESTMRILKNVVMRILKKFYDNGFRKFSELPIIREVPLDGSHDTKNCEGCSLGFCALRLQNNTTEPPISPFSYMDIRSSSSPTAHVSSQNQWNGYCFVHKGSGPSHTTAEPKGETSGQPTPRADRGAVKRNLQSTQGAAPHAPQRTYSEVVRRTGQQSTQQACSQATQGAGMQTTQGTDPKTMLRTIPKDTSGSDTQTTGKIVLFRSNPQLTRTDSMATHGVSTTNGTQAAWRSSPRNAAPNGFGIYALLRPQDNFIRNDTLDILFFCGIVFLATVIGRCFN